jgi:hypothetical protein
MTVEYLPGECAEDSALYSIRASSFLRHSTFVFRHSFHALKKKIPVRMAFITNIASKDSTTEAVVD